MMLEAALDDARQTLSKTNLRSRFLSFSAWTKSLSVALSGSTPGTWLISPGDKRATYAVREAARGNCLVVYDAMIRYREPGSTGRWGALRTFDVRMIGDKQTVVATGPAKPNFALIDYLARFGVSIAFDEDRVLIDQQTEIAHLTGESRLAAAPTGALSEATYVDHLTHPELLTHPTLRSFVEGTAGQGRRRASEVQQVSLEKSGNVPASESPDEVGPSEPRPKADANGCHTTRSKPASECHDEVGPSERQPEAVSAAPVDLDPDQRSAVTLALAEPVCLIDGPPGTGKSQVIVALAAEFTQQGASVIVSSTESPAIDVARRRLRETLGPDARVLIGTPAEVAAHRPPTIGLPDYEVLILDECSMMPMAVALPLMTRASRYVLIGDARQMRPEAGALTVLDQAEHLQVPRKTLRFHYRSADPTLISASNLISYEMQLRTVPTPVVQPSTGLKTHFLPQAETTTTEDGLVNRGEAAAITARIQSYLRADDKRSMGVIAANTAQKKLIEDAIAEDLKRSRPRTIEPLFLRTTNEIQGEERDIILISTVYDGRNQDQRFGAFERSGALSRLNVMLSRSRIEMAVYTSFASRSGLIAQPTLGRQTYLLLHQILGYHSEPETRLRTGKPERALAKRLHLKIDCLGVVFGLRYAGEDRYRVGMVLTNPSKTEEHWQTIIRQLQAKGWRTVELAETDLVTRPKKIEELISAALAQPTNRAT